MKRTVTAMLAAALLMGLMVGPADAKKKKKPPVPKKITREVTLDYSCPCVGRYQFGDILPVPNLGGGAIPLGADENYIIAAEAVDSSGMSVAVNINQDVDGDGLNDGVGSFCDSVDAPIQLGLEREIRIFVGDPTICPGVLLGGSITFTISNLP